MTQQTTAPTPDDIATAQLQLKVLRHYGGPITAVLDELTREAIAAFQKQEKIGEMDLGPKTRDCLDARAGAMFSDVLRVELPEIDRARPAELSRKVPVADDPVRAAHEARLVGLAFSGGGIRSATFNLGVLQALSELRLLHLFDYVSTVSGGGYIGSWLSALIHRRTDGDPRSAAREIHGDNVSRGEVHESPAVRFLRAYSNYLTPRLGLLSADTLAAIATYLRNLYLNLLILTLILAAALMVPRIVGAFSPYIKGWTFPWSDMPNSFVLYGAVLLLFSPAIVGANLGYQPPRDRTPFPWFTTQTAIVCLFWLPGFVGAYIVAYWFNVQCGLLDYPVTWWMIAGATLYFMMWVVGAMGYLMGRLRSLRHRNPAAKRNLVPLLVTALVAGAAGGLLFLGFVHLLEPVKAYFRDRSAAWLAAGFGTVVVLKLMSLVVALHVGLMGRRFSDGVREWWSRLGGLALAFGIGWLALFTISIFAVPVITYLGSAQGIAKWIPEGALGTWIAATVSGVLLGKGQATGTKQVNRALEFVARIAPYVFILGLLTGVALLVHYFLPLMLETADQCIDAEGGGELASVVDFEFCKMNAATPLKLLIVAAGAFGLGLLLSWRVDINLFSLHSFYRFRLTRCYLGATRALERQAQPFTAFDEQDDLPMHELYRKDESASRVWQRPYHVVNTALNLVHGQALEWQQRKAASFVFTPLLSGFELPPTSEADRDQLMRKDAPAVAKQDEAVGEHAISARGCYRPSARSMETGVSLGTAFAISGAAASPNMGYHSAPALAFLMTVFNVRLGRWCGNPADPGTWKDSGPGVAAKYLYDELVGNTTSTAPYVYLSDGGHFENLGVYELVRRRCRFILACDAGQDQSTTFEDLGNAIRKCQADLGIPIEIDVSPIRPRGDAKRSEWHCAVGSVRYDLRDADAVPGTLLYIKPSLVGDEPTDVLQYAAADATFPHQSTNDQWFDESQFESYRKLGYHIGLRALAKAKAMAQAEVGATPPPERVFFDLEGLIVALRRLWYPPARGEPDSFTRLASTLDAIYERLRSDPHLRFLDAQIYPSWESLVKDRKYTPPKEQWLPDTYLELREGFYLCNSVVQLMENVYLDLRLETEHDHPDNRGWMNLFRHWSWCNMFRVTWALAASTYGARFQNFCERTLGLYLGEVEVRPQDLDQALQSEEVNFLEKQLVDLFLRQNATQRDDEAGKIPRDRIGLYLLDLAVRDPQLSTNQIRFTFGIALVLKDGDERRLIYLRIQDHLRDMGLARVALKRMAEDYDVRSAQARRLVIDPDHADLVREEVGEREQAEFMRLFRSVQYELQGRAK